MLKSLKRLALQVCKNSSVFELVGGSQWRTRRLAILCYHGVTLEDEHEWDPRFYVSPAILEERFRMLREKKFNVLPLGEAVRRLYDGTLPPRSVAITFDDGCFDFYHHAFPLLKKYGLPATLYLTTFYCYHPRPVFGMLCYYLMWKGRNTFRGGRLMDLDFEPDLSTEAGRIRAAGAFVASVEKRGLELAGRDALAEQLAGQLGVDYEAVCRTRILQLMTPEEIAQLAQEGLDIQLHTHRHRTPMDRSLFLREIDDNRHHIRAITGDDSRAVHFCYPSGVHASEFLPWLADASVLSATTCEAGLASAGDHRFLLPRIVDTSTLTPIEFEGWLEGVGAMLSQASRLALAGK